VTSEYSAAEIDALYALDAARQRLEAGITELASARREVARIARDAQKAGLSLSEIGRTLGVQQAADLQHDP
jgi:hypothetical protein